MAAPIDFLFISWIAIFNLKKYCLLKIDHKT